MSGHGGSGGRRRVSPVGSSRRSWDASPMASGSSTPTMRSAANRSRSGSSGRTPPPNARSGIRHSRTTTGSPGSQTGTTGSRGCPGERRAGCPSSRLLLPPHALNRAARGDHADRAGHAGAVVRAVPVRVLGVRQVLLVVVLSEVEVRRGHDLRCDLPVPSVREPLLIAGHRLLRGGLLLRRVIEDDRPVLGAQVVALPHALSGIV